MRSIREIANITHISIRTLRYYDEIGLLKPSALTESGHRLYDDKALEKLQQIMFFRELEIPLMDMKGILEQPNYNKKEVLQTQKSILEKKRDRLNGIIELITDVLKGVNTMSFEAFNENDIQKIFEHTKNHITDEDLKAIIKKYGSLEKFYDAFSAGLQNEQVTADLIKWYGDKEKAIAACLDTTDDLISYQEENKKIYEKLMEIKESNLVEQDESASRFTCQELEKELIAQLATLYKKMFHLDNARAMLLDLAAEYELGDALTKANDDIYGEGSSKYIAGAIKRYYGL